MENAHSNNYRNPAEVFARSSIAQTVNSIANPHLNDDSGVFNVFLGDVVELKIGILCR